MIEFADTIDIEANHLVHNLDHALLNAEIDGVLELVPTYRSLMISYDPLIVTRERLASEVETALGMKASIRRRTKHWTIPVCYEPEFGLDLEDVARAVGLSEAEVIRRHSEGNYRVFMCGFAPGFPYMAGLPKELNVARRTTPRNRIESGSIIVAGGQALITTLAMPSGWHVLGRTPVRIFDLERPDPFLLSPGDRVSFEPIDRARYANLEALGIESALTAVPVP